MFLTGSEPLDRKIWVPLLSYIDLFTKTYCLSNHRLRIIPANHRQLLSNYFPSMLNGKKVGTIKLSFIPYVSKMDERLQEMNPKQTLPNSAQFLLMSSCSWAIIPESEYSRFQKSRNLKTWCGVFCFLLYSALHDPSGFSVSLHKTYTSVSFYMDLLWIDFFSLILQHNYFVPIVFLACSFLFFLGTLIWIQISSKKQKLISVARNRYLLTKNLSIDEFKINANVKEQYILLCTKTRSENRSFSLVLV